MGILVKNRENEILFRKINIPEYSWWLMTQTLNSDSYKYHSPKAVAVMRAVNNLIPGANQVIEWQEVALQKQVYMATAM